MNLYDAHRQWARRPADERFHSLGVLAAALHERRELSRETAALAGETRVACDDRGELYLESRGARYRFTNWSFDQLCERASAPTRFMMALRPETAALVLNERLPDESPGKLFSMDHGNGAILRAVTSHRYGRIWDADVVEAVRRVVEDNPRWHNPPECHPVTGETRPGGLYAGDRDIFLFLIDGGSVYEEGPRAVLHRGLIITNSEVGNSRLTLMTFPFNVVCGNHIVYGAQEINLLGLRHDHSGPERFRNQFVPALVRFMNGAVDVGVVRRAQQVGLRALPRLGHHEALDADWMKDLARTYGFSLAEVHSAMEHAVREEGKCNTVWDLVQGMTERARENPYQDTRLELEWRAARLLTCLN